MDEQGRIGEAVEQVRKHVGKVLWAVASLAALYILWSVMLRCAGCEGSRSLWVAVVVVSLAVAGHFVNAFTRDLSSSQGNERLGRELRTIFIYGYVLQGLALGTGLLLLIGAISWVPDEGDLGGLVYGCQKSEAGYGSDLARCEGKEPVQQWLLHVGSGIRADRPFEAEDEIELLEAVEEGCDSQSPVQAIGEALTEFGSSAGVASAVAAACKEATEGRRARVKELLLVNDVVLKQYKLSGGLVVPLYVVVLSLMGAAVGMSRRLPEIQRQAAHSVQSSGKGISAIVARERVVFQIMQVLAAPLIAVTAFATFEPDTITAAVIIGFASGFASEAVLMKLRQASEALTRDRSEIR